MTRLVGLDRFPSPWRKRVDESGSVDWTRFPIAMEKRVGESGSVDWTRSHCHGKSVSVKVARLIGLLFPSPWQNMKVTGLMVALVRYRHCESVSMKVTLDRLDSSQSYILFYYYSTKRKR